MTLIELLRQLEARLGYHQLPLNPTPRNVKEIFESSPLHHDFMKRLVQSVCTANQCQRLNDTVERAATFEAVAPLRLEVLRSERTDVDLYRLIEEICDALDAIFGPRTQPSYRTPKTAVLAQVIELAPFRRRRLKFLT